MQTFNFPQKTKKTILALGAESAGNFSIFKDGQINFSEDFGDLLDETNFSKFKKAAAKFLKDNKIKPDVILTDLHPDYKTTLLGKELTKKFKAEHIQIQHHLAHICSQIGNQIMEHGTWNMEQNSFGIALDGTGYGLDGKIWGGEIFKLKAKSEKLKAVRIGHLENQTMIGGELAIKEPARMIISILDKFSEKDIVYSYVKKYYTRNQFELLHNQLQQNFNCQETSSAGRVLDAVSVLLGFAKNERNFKHEATYLLEQNSTKPYNNLRPKFKIQNSKSQIKNDKQYELSTTHLFEYLIKNLHKDKKRLAATAQLYIAQGLDAIIKIQDAKHKTPNTILSGGISNNKIILDYFISKNKKKPGISIETPGIPRGDAGLSFGQVACLLSINKPLK